MKNFTFSVDWDMEIKVRIRIPNTTNRIPMISEIPAMIIPYAIEIFCLSSEELSLAS